MHRSLFERILRVFLKRISRLLGPRIPFGFRMITLFNENPKSRRVAKVLSISIGTLHIVKPGRFRLVESFMPLDKVVVHVMLEALESSKDASLFLHLRTEIFFSTVNVAIATGVLKVVDALFNPVVVSFPLKNVRSVLILHSQEARSKTSGHLSRQEA